MTRANDPLCEDYKEGLLTEVMTQWWLGLSLPGPGHPPGPRAAYRWSGASVSGLSEGAGIRP
jgi:hypothetical protein